MRTVILISSLFAAAYLVYMTVGKKTVSQSNGAHIGASSQLDDAISKPSPDSSARQRPSLDERSKARGLGGPNGTRKPTNPRRPVVEEDVNRALLEQVKALRKEVAELRRRQTSGPGPSQASPSDGRPADEPGAEIDHNPDIPGIQQVGEGAGRRVLGDPQNTIHPETPERLIAADLAIKAESQKLTKAAEEAYEKSQGGQ